MSNYIKSGSTLQNAITKNTTFNVGVSGGDDYGPTNLKGFYKGIIPPVGGYTIYMHKESQGPSIHVAHDDEQCIFFLKSFGATGSTISEVLAWSTGRTDIWVQTQEITLEDLPNNTTVTPTPIPATNTPTPTATSTPLPATSTPTPTPTFTNTPIPATSTPTPTPTLTNTPEPTSTPTPTVVSAVSSGLVLYFDPSNPSSYPGSGTTITDLSGNGRNGIMSNITYTSPYFTYNGSSSQIAIADNALLEPGSGDWTMEVWVNQSVAGNDVVLGKFPAGGATVSYSIRTTNTSYYAQLASSSGYQNSTTHVGTIGTWYQIVYVFTNVATNTFETFVNGSSIGSVSHSLASILNTTTGLYIGSYNNGEYAQWFDGKIGITRLYNRALTSAEVLQNFNVNKSIYGL